MKNLRAIAKLAGAALILYCSGCSPKENAVGRDMNGFILGDDSGPPPVLTVGVGSDIDRFFEKNSFLKSVKSAGSHAEVSLPLLKTVDATYDDGEINFHVGCATTTNIEGNATAGGISEASFYLCHPSINDWNKATRDLEAMINTFASQNKNLASLRKFRQHHSFAEASARWETDLLDHFTDREFPLSEQEANQFLKDAADGGHVQQLRLWQGSSVLMEAFANEKVLIFFEIAKLRNRGGENLTIAERNEMKYQAVVTFRRRVGARP
jgi:hypothetical protein